MRCIPVDTVLSPSKKLLTSMSTRKSIWQKSSFVSVGVHISYVQQCINLLWNIPISKESSDQRPPSAMIDSHVHKMKCCSSSCKINPYGQMPVVHARVIFWGWPENVQVYVFSILTHLSESLGASIYTASFWTRLRRTHNSNHTSEELYHESVTFYVCKNYQGIYMYIQL